jgi:predicted small lipoprotein YifL
MKRKTALLLVLTIVMLAFAACGGNGTPTEQTPSDENPPASGAVKTGLAVITSTAKSADAGGENGLAEADSTIVAVTVDDSGKIANCTIDAAQTKIEFSKEGKIVTPLDTIFVGKQELGADYGLKKASGIGKEWNEQANAFANYVIGKTVDDVKGIAVTDGYAADEDLKASVTIHITDFIDGVEKAVNNAQDLGASAGDKLGLGVVTNIAKSTDVTADADGVAEAYSYYTATTFDADGVITSSVIDASIADVTFDKTGKITSDVNGTYKTKNELGDEYGMRKASSLGKEWNEQAFAFAQYVVGKTVDEVKGIAVSEGKATDEDLKSQVTVHITDFQTILEKAASTAK